MGGPSGVSHFKCHSSQNDEGGKHDESRQEQQEGQPDCLTMLASEGNCVKCPLVQHYRKVILAVECLLIFMCWWNSVSSTSLTTTESDGGGPFSDRHGVISSTSIAKKFSHTSQNRQYDHSSQYKPLGGDRARPNILVGSDNYVIGVLRQFCYRRRST